MQHYHTQVNYYFLRQASPRLLASLLLPILTAIIQGRTSLRHVFTEDMEQNRIKKVQRKAFAAVDMYTFSTHITTFRIIAFLACFFVVHSPPSLLAFALFCECGCIAGCIEWKKNFLRPFFSPCVAHCFRCRCIISLYSYVHLFYATAACLTFAFKTTVDVCTYVYNNVCLWNLADLFHS